MMHRILDYVEKLGYKIFTDGDYNLNLIFVRDPRRVPGEWNDFACVFYKRKGQWEHFISRCTTMPGLKYLREPINPNGTAILVPGQYRGSHGIGKHRGQYTALTQKKPVSVYRDNDRDRVFDLSGATVETSMIGLNIHAVSEGKSDLDDKVYAESAGCIVFKNWLDFEFFMGLCEISNEFYGNSFSVTLVEPTAKEFRDLNIQPSMRE